MKNQDITIPLDRKGLVIYFTINGKPFFFNGHSGDFADSFPGYFQKVFQSFAAPRRERQKMIRRLSSLHGHAVDDLSAEISMYRNGLHPAMEDEDPQTEFAQPMSPNVFNVYLAQSCNLACRYCFNDHGRFGGRPTVMSDKTAREVLRFISREVHSGTHRSVGVNLFGGEPLLASKAAYILVRGLQDLNKKKMKTGVHIILSTNGTIYNKELFEIFKEFPDKSTVVVSLDAFREVHNRNRPFPPGQSSTSYNLVLSNIRKMQKDDVPLSVTCVVPYPFSFKSAAQKLLRLGIRRFEIKELIYHVYGGHTHSDVFTKDFDLWRKHYIEYSDYFIRNFKHHYQWRDNNKFSLIGDYARSLGSNDGFSRTLACGIGDVKVGIAANGNIYACESLLGHNRFSLGKVSKGFNKQEYEKFRDWTLLKGQFRIHNRRCKNCFAKRICGGGCYAVSYDKDGRLSPMKDEACKFIREKVKIDLYYISLFRKKYPKLFAQLNGEESRQEC
jgi:uncharacterized protein